MASLFLVRHSDGFLFRKNPNYFTVLCASSRAALTQFHSPGLRNKLVWRGVSNHGRKRCDVTKGASVFAVFALPCSCPLPQTMKVPAEPRLWSFFFFSPEYCKQRAKYAVFRGLASIVGKSCCNIAKTGVPVKNTVVACLVVQPKSHRKEPEYFGIKNMHL